MMLLYKRLSEYVSQLLFEVHQLEHRQFKPNVLGSNPGLHTFQTCWENVIDDGHDDGHDLNLHGINVKVIFRVN